MTPKCGNYIKILQFYTENRLLVCGANVDLSRCYLFNVSVYIYFVKTSHPARIQNLFPQSIFIHKCYVKLHENEAMLICPSIYF